MEPKAFQEEIWAHVESFQGKGTFVVEEAIALGNQDIKNKIIKFVDLGLEEAFENGMSPEEFLDIVNQRVIEKKQMMDKIIAIYIECNIEQSRVFSKQLSDNSNMNVMALTIADLKGMTKEGPCKAERK